ncbi:MAG: AAA family ATPase [Bacteroidota bacterium]|jgi:predicted ATPase
MRRLTISKLTIEGFKSIRKLDGFEPSAINVFIGQNGAGKSNFINFFKFLANMLSGTGNLSEYTGRMGGATEILFEGDENTPLKSEIILTTDAGRNEYSFRLSHASGDSFIFNEEKFRFIANNRHEASVSWVSLGSGHKEAQIIQINKESLYAMSQTVIKSFLQKLSVYQFHNTTTNSPIRETKADVQIGWFLNEDGRNIAAVLFQLKNNEPSIYQKIVLILRQIIPFFDDFELYSEYDKVYLRWREKQSSKIFVATHASDGMLRAMALVTLLNLPKGRLPDVIFIDEPELGLHPSAIGTICSLIHSASEYSQIFIATQNGDMLNEFSADDIVVVKRNGRESEFVRFTEEQLSVWLEDYSLSELWNKNVLGGKP